MEWLCLLDDEVECKVLRQGGCLILFFIFLYASVLHGFDSIKSI